MLVDDFLPAYDVSDAVATVVHADVATTWDALMEVDLIEVGRKRPLVGMLGAIRVLPDIVSQMLHGELPQRPPQHLRLRDTARIRHALTPTRPTSRVPANTVPFNPDAEIAGGSAPPVWGLRRWPAPGIPVPRRPLDQLADRD
jgi:hypothetical protein